MPDPNLQLQNTELVQYMIHVDTMVVYSSATCFSKYAPLFIYYTLDFLPRPCLFLFNFSSVKLTASPEY